jgi:DNA-binding transcriptional LysR family regulator
MSRRIDWETQIGRQLRLRDLHAFFAVVQQGSMAKAAAQLNVSQPAISKVIAELEYALGVRLFDRSPKGVELTIFGRALFKRGWAAFDELKQGIRDIEFLADPTTGEVNVGCPVGIGNTSMLRIVERFRDKYPRVVLHVDAVSNPQSFPGLHDRKCDLYVTLLPLPEHRVPEGLNVEFLFSDPLVVAAESAIATRTVARSNSPISSTNRGISHGATAGTISASRMRSERAVFPGRKSACGVTSRLCAAT